MMPSISLRCGAPALLVLIVMLLLPPAAAHAQFFSFGRNKVQYTNFDWHVLKTEHFDIYYYPEMRDLAERGAAFAEESYKVLEQKFTQDVSNRIPLIFYSSHLHFEQTNTTPGFIPEGVGGFFEFLKGRVVIPYDGSMWNFRHVIRHELVHVFMHARVNRVLLDHRMTQDRLPPLWFVEGLAEYWSTDWDVQAEMVLRDAVVSNYLVPLSDMDDIFGTYLMYKEGQNVLQFVGERYGEEKILLLIDNFWKSNSFDEVFRLTLGRGYREFDEEWVYALKKKYYPLLARADEPSAVTRPLMLEGFNAKPVYYPPKKEVWFIGNHTGYAGIFRIPYPGKKRQEAEQVIEGEKSDEFETFHLFQSRLDISRDGILAFVTKSGENDALHLYDIGASAVVASYHFKDLVVLGSPSWAPDGKRLVISAVDKSGNNDLYIWDRTTENLQRLTNDIYDERDPDWSPDGRTIVFTSDRTPYGEHGTHNLFACDAATGAIRYVAYGSASCTSPRYSPDGRSLVFVSEEGGARNIWMMKLDSLARSAEMRKLTEFTTGAFDPAWADSDIVFTAFQGFSFQLRAIPHAYAAYDSSTTIRPVTTEAAGVPWRPAVIGGVSETKMLKYTGEYSLDIAESQIATDPVFGTSGGAFLALSDLLGNEQYNFLLYNTAQSSDELLSSFNIAISRLSLHQRTNYAYGIYRFSGRRYDLTDPAEFFFERVFGGYFTLSYPLSKFQRIGLTTSVSHSDKDVSDETFFGTSGSDNVDRSRRALFLSNAISFTHDNSLWGPSGPLDGWRFNVTLAYTSDIQYSNADYYSVILDYRRYIRLAQRSSFATRAWLFYNDGKEARRFFMGGSWDLRGYPRWSIRGKKLWLTSNELRFPFIDALAFRFPFGGISFVGIRGALFFDAGNAWDDQYTETLGSVGAGARLNLGGVLVLRYDIGKRIEENFHHFQEGVFNQFFFGWDF